MNVTYFINLTAIFSVALAGAPAIQAQIASTSDLTEKVVSITPQDVLLEPSRLVNMWAMSPVPLSYYSWEDIKMQRLINENTADAIVTHNPADSESEWTEIDREDITPYTWKWIDLALPEPDGARTNLSLRRPNWWIKEAGADSIGKAIYLDLPELGIRGWATVRSIRVNQLDTRLSNWNNQEGYTLRPITGKFEHVSNEVYDLFFENDTVPIGVTKNHPIWSNDRSGWVSASDLVSGENLKAHRGAARLMRMEKIWDKRTVYNLEVYRDHTYFVSTNSVLVHNKGPWHIRRSKNFSSAGEILKIGDDIEVNYIVRRPNPIALRIHVQEIKVKASTALLEIVRGIKALYGSRALSNSEQKETYRLWSITFKKGTLTDSEVAWLKKLNGKKYEGMRINADDTASGIRLDGKITE